jgi:hypothetical protein
MIGLHCNSEKVMMKTSFFSFSDNYEISTFTSEDLYNTSNFKPIVSAVINNEDCSFAVNLTSYTGNDIYDPCFSYNADDCVYILKILNFKGWFGKTPYCSICDDQRQVYFNALNPFSNNKYIYANGQYCFSVAYANGADNCPRLEQCDIPTGYKFNNLTGNFECFLTSLCGGNSTEIMFDVDMKLNSMGAKPLYSNIDSKDYKNAVGFRCDSNLNPQISVFRIPIFDYRLWLFIYLLGFLIFFYSRFIK